MAARPQLAWPILAVPIVAIVWLLHWSGALARVESAVAEARAKVLAHEQDSDIVIVGIDARSLRALNEWPWPRRHHARLLQQLRRAAPRAIFLDIDFSSVSNEEDDGLFEQALEDSGDTPIFLAAHFQPASGTDNTLSWTKPLPRFARHASLVSVVLQPGRDGLVRRMRSSWSVDGQTLPSIFGANARVRPGENVLIDFSIKDSSFGYVSYIDILNGTIDPKSLRGKTLYVGPTAVELRDVVPVPVYRALPGVIVQAFAAETAHAGALTLPPDWIYFVLLAAWAAACVTLFGKRSWRANAIVVGAGFVLLAAATLYAYAELRLALDIVPPALLSVALFVAATLRSLDQQTWRALAYAVGLKRRDALLKSVVESTTDAIVCVDERCTIRTANPATARLLGLATSSLLGQTLTDYVDGLFTDTRRSIADLPGAVLECTVRSASAGLIPVELSVSRIATEGGHLFTAIVRDISERKAQQVALEHQAKHDPLTGLPNRLALSEHLGAVLEQAASRQRVALLMLDLCRFKEVNDTLGHDVGDDVLREVARRFTADLPEGGFIARIGGDEFTVVLSRVESRGTIDDLCRTLVASLQSPIDARGIAIEVGVSIGIAIAPEHAQGSKELLRHADVAMYVAKRQGSAFEYYQREDDQHTVRRLSMLSELRAAIDRSGISLHYQPQVSLRTGHAESVEALVRWHHAVHGSIGPAEFVTLAESTDLIRPLTDWTITQALSDMTKWRSRIGDTTVAINVSARVLQDSDFPRRLQSLLATAAVRPDHLELEITESAMLVDPERARIIVRDLRALGVTISIDDYGTGFSSLGYLRDLQVQALKLDKSFVVDLETREQNRVIVESTVQMAHALGLRAVAEGVETAWVKDYLQSIGYDLGQGFWFARPMAAEECAAWISQHNGALAEQRCAS